MKGDEWAVQRRLDDFLEGLEAKYGGLRGRVEVAPRPGVTFEEIGGLEQSKAEILGLSSALRTPDLYREWGITPPRGALLYGPPGTGKTLLAKALATLSEALFFHLRLANLTSKIGPNTAELVRGVFGLATSEGKGVVFLDEADALSLEHVLSPDRAREASVQLIGGLVELLDGLDEFPNLMILAATNRPDAIDPVLIAPGRLDRIIEVPLPEGAALREIIEIHRVKAEGAAGRPLFDRLDFDAIVPRVMGMSGAEMAEVIRRALEGKVQLAGTGQAAGLVTTPDLLQAIDAMRRIRDVVGKIRYGQYL